MTSRFMTVFRIRDSGSGVRRRIGGYPDYKGVLPGSPFKRERGGFDPALDVWPRKTQNKKKASEGGTRRKNSIIRPREHS